MRCDIIGWPGRTEAFLFWSGDGVSFDRMSLLNADLSGGRPPPEAPARGAGLQAFVPKLIVCLREGYTRRLFAVDLLAGVTVGVIALPLAIAFTAVHEAHERGDRR